MMKLNRLSSNLIFLFYLFSGFGFGAGMNIVFAKIIDEGVIKDPNTAHIKPSKIRIDASQALVKNHKKTKENTAKIAIGIKSLKNIIKSNNPELKAIGYEIKEAEYNLGSKISTWYPSITLSSDGVPKYIHGRSYNKFSNDTSSSQLKTSLTASAEWDVINPSRIPDIEEAKDNLKKAQLLYAIKLKDLHINALNQFFILQKSYENIRKYE